MDPTWIDIVEDRLRAFGVLPDELRLTPRGAIAAIAVPIVVLLLLILVLTSLVGGGDPEAEASATPDPSSTAPVTVSTAEPTVVETIQATATVYGPGLEGNPTASGEIFDSSAATAAHPELEFGTLVRVTNPANGLQTTVTINDRLPDAGRDRIDLSIGAGQAVGVTIDTGPTAVVLEVLG